MKARITKNGIDSRYLLVALLKLCYGLVDFAPEFKSAFKIFLCMSLPVEPFFVLAILLARVPASQPWQEEGVPTRIIRRISSLLKGRVRTWLVTWSWVPFSSTTQLSELIFQKMFGIIY